MVHECHGHEMEAMTASETRLEWLVRIFFSVFGRCLLLTFSHSLFYFRDKASYIGQIEATGSLCSGLPFDQFMV